MVNEPTFHTVARSGEVEPGEILGVVVAGRSIALANAGGQLRAFGNLCTCLAHFSIRFGEVRGNDQRDDPAAGRLADGSLHGETVACPLHGTAYDIATGAAVGGPGKIAVNTYEVIDAAGAVLVADMSDAERQFWRGAAIAV